MDSHKPQPAIKCICQICSCGCHRCPHQDSAIYEKLEKSNLISEYTDKYPAHQYRPVVSYKPKDVYQKSPVELESLTTSRADYVSHMVVPRKPKACSKYQPNEEYMDLDTVYMRDYGPHPVRPSVAYKPLQCRQTYQVKKDETSTYQDDYQLWNSSKRESMKPAPTYDLPKERFDVKSTFQDNFQFWPIRPKELCKPVHLYTEFSAPPDYTTNYRKEYVPYIVERRPIRKKEKLKPNEEPFNCLTTNNQDYKGLPGKAAKPLQPQYCLTASDTAFSGLTEFQDKYQIWPLAPSLEKQSVPYKKPKDKMDFISTTQFDYRPNIIQPRISSKPVRQYRKCSKAFEGCSTMKEDFRPWLCKKASPVRPQPNCGLSVGHFENTTTTRCDYVAHPLTQTRSFKPVNKPFMSLISIDAQTTYNSNYTVKPIQMCPASRRGLPGYEYLRTDSLGHKQYKLQKENKCDFNHIAAGPLSAECSPV